jgi:inosine/xanthosine triphosphatase
MSAVRHIAVGSTNPVKIAAVRAVAARAFPGATVEGLGTDSGVPAQPWGDAETRRGALNRARAALAAGADLGVGLEGGMVESELGLMTCAWCIIVDAGGRIGVGGGVHVLVPPAVADTLQAGGELGPAMDQLTGQHNTKQAEGAVGILTAGLSNRQSAYEQLVAMALAPFVRPEYYQVDGRRPALGSPG